MKKTAALLLSLLAISGGTYAAGDAAAGKSKSGVCAACHGAKGVAVLPGYPSLAGQNAAYLEQALKAYKNKQRTNPQAMIMQPQAAMLSDADIANLAAYYSSL